MEAAKGGNRWQGIGLSQISTHRDFAAEVSSQRRSLEALGIEIVMLPLFRSLLAATVVRTGPAGTQRLLCRRLGSGVGAEYAPTPSTARGQLGLANKLQGRTSAWFAWVPQQYSTRPGKAPFRAARPNTSLKRSANGRPPAPGRWYAVHFHRPGAGALPLSPA